MRPAVPFSGGLHSKAECMFLQTHRFTRVSQQALFRRGRAPHRCRVRESFAVRNGWSDLSEARKHLRQLGTALRSAPPIRLPMFVVYTAAASGTSWVAHPYLLDFARFLLHLSPKDNVTAFQTSFFSFLSLIFAIYSGNTMAFLYDRQKSLMMNLYCETMALERLTEEAIHTLGPNARDILSQIRVYIDTEIYSPENQSPPLGEGSPLALIRAKARNYRVAGTDIGDILGAAQHLAEKQNERQATAVRLLPRLHWALLYVIGGLFVCTFLLFETGGGFSDEGRHTLFTVLCGLMTFVLCALRDLSSPTCGIYNTTSYLDARVQYVKTLLDKYEGDSSRRLTARPSFSNGARGADQKQVTTTSGVVGALGVSVSASGLSKEQTPESANGSESLKAERETWLSGEPPPALFELASGLFQGRRQDDAGESSPRGSVDSVDSADCAAPGAGPDLESSKDEAASQAGGWESGRAARDALVSPRSVKDEMEDLRLRLSEAVKARMEQQRPESSA